MNASYGYQKEGQQREQAAESELGKRIKALKETWQERVSTLEHDAEVEGITPESRLILRNRASELRYALYTLATEEYIAEEVSRSFTPVERTETVEQQYARERRNNPYASTR